MTHLLIGSPSVFQDSDSSMSDDTGLGSDVSGSGRVSNPKSLSDILLAVC